MEANPFSSPPTSLSLQPPQLAGDSLQPVKIELETGFSINTLYTATVTVFTDYANISSSQKFSMQYYSPGVYICNFFSGFVLHIGTSSPSNSEKWFVHTNILFRGLIFYCRCTISSWGNNWRIHFAFTDTDMWVCSWIHSVHH